MIEYKVDSTLSQSQIELLVSKIHYSIPSLSFCTLSRDRNTVSLELDPSCEAEARETVRDLELEVRAVSVPPVETLRSNMVSGDNKTKPVAGPTNQFADGVVGPGARDICNRLRDTLLQLCSSHARGDFLTYQTAIREETMVKCGYIHRFPQNIYSVHEFSHDYRQLGKVRSSERPLDLASRSGFLLSPATCFHCYETLADKIIDDDTALLATSRCFRHEAPWRLGLHRLREFEMLELVIFGARGYVDGVRADMIERAWSFFDGLGLCGKVITAQDPFYFAEDASLATYQAAGSMKYELIASVGQHDVAIASFNTVGTTLSRQFNIRSISGKLPHSGCVAFGIERWAVALMHAYGADFNVWPEAVKSRFGGRP